jgi:transcriptional regulator with XRE-family HTH domain
MGNLKELRLKRGLTQQQVADALNVTRPTVVYWEQGKAHPHAKHIKSLARILKCKAVDLLP